MGDRGQVGEITGDEREGGLGAEKGCELFLEKLVSRALTPDQSGGKGANAERLERRGAVGFHTGMRRQAEIVVICEADEWLAAAFCILSKAIYRGEKRISEVEDGFPRQSKPLRSVVAEAVVSGHAERVPVAVRSGRRTVE